MADLNRRLEPRREIDQGAVTRTVMVDLLAMNTEGLGNDERKRMRGALARKLDDYLMMVPGAERVEVTRKIRGVDRTMRVVKIAGEEVGTIEAVTALIDSETGVSEQQKVELTKFRDGCVYGALAIVQTLTPEECRQIVRSPQRDEIVRNMLGGVWMLKGTGDFMITQMVEKIANGGSNGGGGGMTAEEMARAVAAGVKEALQGKPEAGNPYEGVIVRKGIVRKDNGMIW